MTGRELLDAVLAERFPHWRDVLNEASRQPQPVPTATQIAEQQRHHRRLLLAALGGDGWPNGHTRHQTPTSSHGGTHHG